MSTLADTIRNALIAAGPATAGRLHDLVAELDGLNLTQEDRLAVLATAIGAAAAIHHARHKAVYLEAVQTWALEISVGLVPPPVRLSRLAGDGPIEEGAEILINGLEGLVDSMSAAGVGVQDRLATELALFSQLLGRHDAQTIHLTLMAVAEAVALPEYRPGQTIRVPLQDMAVPLGRDACLATLAPRGVA